MESGYWISWTIRVVLAAVLVGGLIIGLRWLKGGNGSWRDMWESVGGALRNQVKGVLAFAGGLFLLAALFPLAQPEPEMAQAVVALLGVLWVIVAAWALTIASSIVVRFVGWRYDIEVADNLHARKVNTRIRILQKTVVVIIWVGALAGVLLQFESFRALGTTLLASAGLLSIIVGISAQKTFGAVFAGIQVALTQPIKIDDVVIVEGEWGRIEEIAFTYVVVRIWDQRRLIVPVTYFLEKPFQNWTRKSADITGSVTLYVDYETPLEPLREELRRLCESSGALWDGNTCVLQVTDTGSDNMTVRALAGSPDASSAWELRCMIREGLISFLKEHHPNSLPKRRLSISGTVGEGGE